MKNLFKNVFGSFKSNKLVLIGLTFLIFLTIVIYCLLSNVSINISNRFNQIATSSNLHDFTISELYDNGSAAYDPHMPGISVAWDNKNKTAHFDYEQDLTAPAATKSVNFSSILSDTDCKWDKTTENHDSGIYYYALPSNIYKDNWYKVNEETKEITVENDYMLNLSSLYSTGLYQNYAKNAPESSSKVFVIKSINTYKDETDLPQSIKALKALENVEVKKWHETECKSVITNNAFIDDYNLINNQISNQQNVIYSDMHEYATPMVCQLQNKYKDIIKFRNFNSLNITSLAYDGKTSDMGYAKVIESNPTDEINKMFLLDDIKGNKGNNLFDSELDYEPNNSKVQFFDEHNKPVKPYEKIVLYSDKSENQNYFNVPSTFEELVRCQMFDFNIVSKSSKRARAIFSQLLHIRFKRMYVAENSNAKIVNECINPLAAIKLDKDTYCEQLFTKDSDINKAYVKYFNNFYKSQNETVNISNNGKIIFQWMQGAIPSTCAINNLTGYFCIDNYNFMQKHNKEVITENVFNNFEPYAKFVKLTDKDNKLSFVQKVRSWINWLNADEFKFWMSPTLGSEQTFRLPDDSTITVNQNEYKGIEAKYLTRCGGYTYINWGSGITSDFMYPIVDLTRPSVNPNDECLLYLNSNGYKSFKLAFANSQTESFLECKFLGNLSKQQQKNILNDINKFAHANMLYPQEVNAAYLNNDTSNILNASGYRIAFVLNLIKTINILRYVMTVLIGFLCLFICVIIIIRFIQSSRVTLGILRALGYSKTAIAMSMTLFTLLPTIIGSIAGYFTALFLQIPALGVLSSYWLVPTSVLAFSPLSLIVTIITPLFFFAVVAILTTIKILLEKPTSLMKNEAQFKSNIISRNIKIPFSGVGIMTRFRISIAFNSLPKLFVLSLMSTLSMGVIGFSFGSLNKLSESKMLDASQHSYSFALKLTTPTANGGVYKQYDMAKYDDSKQTVSGISRTDASQYIYNPYYCDENEFGSQYVENLIKPYYQQLSLPTYTYMPSDKEAPMTFKEAFTPEGQKNSYSTALMPNFYDSIGQTADLMYLRNRVCDQFIMNHIVGFGTSVSNPWGIAISMMPVNAASMANNSIQTTIQKVGKLIYEAKEGSKWFLSLKQKASDPKDAFNAYCDYIYWDKDEKAYKLNYTKTGGVPTTDVHYTGNTIIQTGLAINQYFLNLVKLIYSDKDLNKDVYQITYGALPLNKYYYNDSKNKNDETYTYITSKILSLSNNHEFDKSKELEILGIKPESEYITLTDNQTRKNINNLLDQSQFKQFRLKANQYPIIINAYTAHKYNLNVNDYLSVNLTNRVDRVLRQNKKEMYKEDDRNIANFKVVAISSGTVGEKIYTSQEVANNILGLPNGKTWNDTHEYVHWTFSNSQTNQVKPWNTDNLPGIVDMASTSKYNIQLFKKDHMNQPLDEQQTPDNFNKNVPVGFNGVFTQNDSGEPITTNMPLYSLTGMYPSTSVYKDSTESDNNKFTKVLLSNNNLALANYLSGINEKKYYDACQKFLNGKIKQDEYLSWIRDFISQISSWYGSTTMFTAIQNAENINASDAIYKNVINTFNALQSAIVTVLIPVAILITMIMSSLIINENKKLAAMLKALGYSDGQNVGSFLSIYLPVIAFGLALAIPFGMFITWGYQNVVFGFASILVSPHIGVLDWFASIACVAGTLGITCIGSYISLKRDKLIEMIKQ